MSCGKQILKSVKCVIISP